METYDALEPFVAPWKPGVEAAPLYAHLAYEYGWALLHIVGPKWYDEQPDGQSAERALLARRAMLSAALKPEHPSSLAGLYVLRDPVVRATTTQPWPDVVALVCAKASAAEDPGRAALQEACRVDLAAPPPDPASAPKKKVTERQLRAASEAVEGGTPFAVAFASLVARLGAPHATQGSDLVWATMGAPYCSELRVTKRGDKIGRPLYISYDRAVMPDGFDACVKSAY